MTAIGRRIQEQIRQGNARQMIVKRRYARSNNEPRRVNIADTCFLSKIIYSGWIVHKPQDRSIDTPQNIHPCIEY
jgi:hypothetical protein